MSQKSKKQQGAIVALMECSTVAEAATKAGVSRQTLTRWLTEPDFRRRFREVRQQVYDRALGRLVALMNEAISTLGAALRDEDIRGGKVSKQMFLAARTILEHGHNIGAGDLDARLAEIEAELQKMNGVME